MIIQRLSILLAAILVAAGASHSGAPLAGFDHASSAPLVLAAAVGTTDSTQAESPIDLQLRAMDDTIASYRQRKPLLVAGMVGGIVLASVFLIQAQEDALDKAEERAYGSDSRSSSVNPAYYVGMLAGIGLTTVCAFQFNSVSGDISLIQWRQKKLRLQRPQSTLPQGAQISLRF